MTQLEELLLIPDPHERELALLDHAREFGVDPILAKNAHGRYNEEKLVLLIYDALQEQNQKQQKNLRFALIGTAVGVGGIILITLFPRWLNIAYQEAQPQIQSQSRVMRAYDEKGRPVLEDGQPVLFAPMDGTYFEYDDEGKPKYEFLYNNGQLVSRKEFSRDGRVLKEIKFPEP